MPRVPIVRAVVQCPMARVTHIFETGTPRMTWSCLFLFNCQTAVPIMACYSLQKKAWQRERKWKSTGIGIIRRGYAVHVAVLLPSGADFSSGSAPLLAHVRPHSGILAGKASGPVTPYCRCSSLGVRQCVLVHTVYQVSCLYWKRRPD